MTCTPGEEHVAPEPCFMPRCPNRDREVSTITVDIGDEAGAVLRQICADCIQPDY